MIDQNQVRPIRKVAIADHLWDLLDQMAREMGTDRDGLVNQALFMFARLNGYTNATGAAAPASPPTAAARPSQAAMPARPREPVAAPPEPTAAPSPPRSRTAEPAAPPLEADAGPGPGAEEDSERREVRERVFETAAELERLIKGGRGDGSAAGRPEVSEASGPSADDEKALYLMAEDGELDKVAKDRFVIGRGKHCDFIINSGKVSREHAAIVRDGVDYFVEDLGSSNGTWFNKQRIKRRKIEDGDEYYICSEKIKCVIR